MTSPNPTVSGEGDIIKVADAVKRQAPTPPAPAPAPKKVDITVPASIQAEVGEFVTITAETDGTLVKWVCLDPGLSKFPDGLLKDSKTIVFIGVRPGTYRVGAYTAINGVPSCLVICKVQIGQPAPGPGPQPGPGPAPAPQSDLAKKLQAAYLADGRQTDALGSLKGIYSQMVKSADDATLRSVAELYSIMAKAHADTLKGTDAPNLRAAIGLELRGRLAFPATQQLDAATRATLKQAYADVATALSQVQ